MRLAAIAAGALGVCALAAGTAAAHPAGDGCTSTFNGLTEYCPAPVAGLLGDNRLAALREEGDVSSENLTLVSNTPKQEPLASTNSDLAFWGDYAIQGNYNGLSIWDISAPEQPDLVAAKSCPGSQNDVSVWGDLIITSTDSTRNKPECEGNTNGSGTSTTSNWEGLRIFDWSNPADPVLVGSVLTDCGSHTHTLLPDEENGRLLVYVSSYSPGANINCLPPHRKLSIVEIPIANPSAARVISEPSLLLLNPRSSGCHDITVYAAKDLAAGACMGEGIIWDISDKENPQHLTSIVDPNFSFWHSATFSDDASKVIFTDELGGGSSARCTSAYGPTQGADAIYDITDRRLPSRISYYKIPRIQTNEENCVSHNGNLVPHPTKKVFVQAWYQGGTSVVDFTNATAPKEIAHFDRGPVDETRLVPGGHWSSYWYNGYIYGSEIARGFDVLKWEGDETTVRLRYLNVQTQEPLPAAG